MVNPQDLIDIATQLAVGLGEENRGRPKQTELSRAVSCAYYAMFHTLASCCADMMIGATSTTRRAWRQAYRALEHGRTKSRCSNSAMMSQFPQAIQTFGAHFTLMQRQRHLADYDPSVEFRRSQVKQLVQETADRIEQFNAVDASDRRAFSAYVLFPVRQT